MKQPQPLRPLRYAQRFVVHDAFQFARANVSVAVAPEPFIDYVQLAIDAGQLVEAGEQIDTDLDSLTYECYVTTWKRPNFCACR